MPFFYFKEHPASFKLQSHPRLGIQCRKKWAKIFLSTGPHFIAHLRFHLPLLPNGITRHISPPPPPPSVLQYFEQRSIDYVLDIDECATNTHKCSHNENIICLNTEGSFKCICTHGFSGDIHNCIGNEDCLERGASS